MNGQCVLCGSDQSAALFQASDRLFNTTTKRFSVVRCLACGLLRLDPQPPPDELRLYYPDNYWFAPGANAANRLAERYRRIVLRDHLRFIEQALRRSEANGPLVDLGSGGGLLLSLLRRQGVAGVGLDFSREAAAIAWREQQTPTICGDFEAAPFRSGSLGALTMFHVLEHVYDPLAYLTAARSLLQPGGRLIVQVPNAASWQFRVLGRAWNGVDVPRHLFDFRDRDLEQLLVRSGFEIVRKKYFSLRDNPAGLASRPLIVRRAESAIFAIANHARAEALRQFG